MFTVSVQGQHTHIDSVETILPLIKEFNQEAIKRGVYVSGKISKHLGGVRIVEEGVMKKLYRNNDTIPLGLIKYEVNRGLLNHVYIQPMVYIQKKVLINPTLLKWILWHELGHFLGLKHTNGLMSNSITIGITLTDDDWELLLFKFFSDVEVVIPNNRFIKTDNTYE